MPKFGDVFGRIFSKVKQTPAEASTPEKQVTAGEVPAETSASVPAPAPIPPEKVYLKALPLRDLQDIDMIKQEVKSGNILILKVSPLAKKSLDDVKEAISQLMDFTQSVGGDIARLGEERVVITPSFVRIWREKASASNEPVPTAA